MYVHIWILPAWSPKWLYQFTLVPESHRMTRVYTLGSCAVHEEAFTRMFIATLFVIIKNGRPSRCLSTE